MVEDSGTNHKTELYKNIKKQNGSICTAIKGIMTKSICDFIKNKQLLVLTVCSSVISVLFSNVAYLSQAYLSELMFPVQLMGLFYFSFNVTKTFAAKYSRKFLNEFKTKRFFLLLIGISTVLLSFKSLYVAIPVYLIITFIFSFTSLTIVHMSARFDTPGRRGLTPTAVVFNTYGGKV
jgi:hypothetical protein